MNFYASPEYLAVVAEVYFKGRQTCIEDVRIGDEVLRLLVVDKTKVITSSQFLDYHEPLQPAEIRTPTREYSYAQAVVRRVIAQDAWDINCFEGFESAPYVDWTKFPSFEDYQVFIRSRQKGLLKEQQRRRRRLAENFGELVFCVDDTREDVFQLARLWKRQQFYETGVNDYFANQKNVEYFNLLREKGLLVSTTLRASERLLSVWMGFMYNGVWSGWIFAYDHDPELKKYSVGHQLLHSMLEESYRRKHREFDFSIGDEDYKWIYATHARVVGPIGRAPIQQRISAHAGHVAKRILSQNSSLQKMALALRRAYRNSQRTSDLFVASEKEISMTENESYKVSRGA